jgi:predicted tellurium resistance membrane protein TerC
VREIEQSLAQTYRRLTYTSAVLMAVGWVWHVLRGDQTNWLITLGLGLMLLTPLIALAHLAWLAKPVERLAARYSIVALILLSLAVLVGLVLGRTR